MDLKTIFYCLALINLLMALFTLVVKKTQPTFRGINFWIFANLGISLGYFLLTQRDVLPNMITVIFAQTLFFVAGLLRIFGLNQFFEKKPKRWLYFSLYMGLPLYIFMLYFYTIINNEILLRTVIIGFLLSVISVVTGLVILKNKPEKRSKPYVFIAVVFFIFAGLFIARILGWIFIPEIRGLFVSSIFNDMQFFSSIVIDISWTSLFFIIHNQKLTFKLKESEERFRVIFEHNSSALALVNSDTTIVMVNEEYCKMGAYKKEEVVGTSWTQHVHKDELPRLMQYNQLRIKDPSFAPDKYEFKFLNKNGETLYAIMSIGMLPGLKQIIASFTDITELKWAEEKLKKQTLELQTLNKNKNLFFSIIAHDMRNPVASMVSLSDMLKNYNNMLSDKDRQKYIDSIYDVSTNAFSLLEDLLTWAGSQEGKMPFEPRELNFQQIAWDAMESLAPLAAKKNIEISLSQESIMVYADLNMLSTILRNLLSNAIKFSQPRGKIEISAQKKQESVVMSISDSGVGIASSDMDDLWNISRKFSKPGTENERGTGLGLILCKEFVEKHRGKIWAESEPGNGSCFYFELPVKK